MTFSEAMQSDRFFYYGQTDLGDEIESDLFLGFTTRLRGCFYGRRNSAGATRYLNAPPGITQQIDLRFDLASWVAFRNTFVSDGQNGPDRRAAVSQNSISIEIDKTGKAQVQVGFIPYFNPGAGSVTIAGR